MKETGRHLEKIEPVDEILERVLPPNYELWVKLNDAIAKWETVVGRTLGGQSALVDFMGGELLVSADTPLVASRLSMMGGNIIRVLMERWQIEAKGVRVVVGRRPLSRAPKLSPARRVSHVQVKEEDVRALEQTYLKQSPELPEEIAFPLAQLRVFFMNRFGK